MANTVVAKMAVTANTSQASAALTRFGATSKLLSGTMVKLGKQLVLAVGHIAAVAGAFFVATSIIKEYEASLVRAGAIGGMTTAQTAMLGRKLTESAMKYGAASEEMAEGVLQLTKAGFEFADVMEVIDTLTKVNIANNLDYATSAEIGTLVMKAFKIEAEDLESHFDKLQYVVHKTLMDMGDFVELLRYAGSTAITAQVDPEQLYAMAGALADVAQQAGIGARGVNRLMIEMLKEVDTVQKWVDSLGLGVEVIKDGALNIDELIRAFSTLGMTEEVMLKSLEQFSIRSARAWLGLMINAGEYFELIEGQKSATDYLNDVVGPQLDTVERRLARIKETLKGAFRGEAFILATKKALDSLDDGVTALIPSLQMLVLDLLYQAPQMFNMLFGIVQSLIPLLSEGLLPVFAAFSGVLNTIAGKDGLLLRFIIAWMLIRKFTPSIAASMDVITLALTKQKITWQAMSASIAGVVFGLILIMTTSKGIERAIYVIAVAVVALVAAFVALKTVGGDWMAAVKAGIAGAAAAASVLGTISLVRGTGAAVSYDSASAMQRREEALALASHQSGTDYVPRTGLYKLHEGERVSPASGGARGGGNVIIVNRGTIYGDEDALRELIRRVIIEETEEAYY